MNFRKLRCEHGYTGQYGRQAALKSITARSLAATLFTATQFTTGQAGLTANDPLNKATELNEGLPIRDHSKTITMGASMEVL